MKLTPGFLNSLYGWRRVLVYAFYGLLSALTYSLAYLLRFEFSVPEQYLYIFLWTVPGVVLVRLVMARAFTLSSGRWRFISTPDVLRLFLATSAGSALFLATRAALAEWFVVPLSVILIDWVLATFLTAAIWIGYRMGFEWARQVRARASGRPCAQKAIIVGAGEAGNLLAREIQRYPTGYRLLGFVDDDPMKWGTRLQGAPVLGGSADLVDIVNAQHVEVLILAIPSARPKDLRRLVRVCEETKVPFKVLPGIAEVLEGQVGTNQLRELDIEDLLGRKPVKLELPELADDLHGRTVLITGAAGSIGSELSRQVALHRPGKLLLLDQAETELYYLELELLERFPELELIPVIGDVVDEGAVGRLFEEHRPDRVFHAAAYKHVPVLERNPAQAVRNNVIGTWRVADAAGRYGADKFVLVSTDKAVRPANIMGATKRLTELLVLDLQELHPDTAYGAVRFGNVLGSNGSVIPIFRRQLENVRPLTVTHPDVTRYFMTIQEASQLILQASLLPELRGHIAMLDMGEPVRILDLAKNFLRLSGAPARVGEDVIFTGLRPGEKLHEELSSPDESAVETSIPKIRVLRTTDGCGFDLLPAIRRWEHALGNGGSDGAVAEFMSFFEAIRHEGEGVAAQSPSLVGSVE